MKIKESICVFDCETIPDVELIKKTFDPEIWESAGDNEQLISELAMQDYANNHGTTFLPVNYHKIVCISCVMADEFGRFSRVTTIEGKNEKEILEKFLYFINKFDPRLVSFNGRGFDLPMIMVRAMIYNLEASNYFCNDDRSKGMDKWTNYRSRYDGKFHMDLLDHISHFGSVRGLKLDTLCSSIGLPGKYDVHGDQVLELFYASKQAKIDEYCESDVLNTYWLFLKYELLRGNLNLEDYLDYISLMSEYLQKEKADFSYTPVFCDCVQKELDSNIKKTQN